MVRAISLWSFRHHIDKDQYRTDTPWHTCILQCSPSYINSAQVHCTWQQIRQCHPQWHPLVIFFGPPHCPGSKLSSAALNSVTKCEWSDMRLVWHVVQMRHVLVGEVSNGRDILVKSCCRAESRSALSLVLSYSSTTNLCSTDSVVPSFISTFSFWHCGRELVQSLAISTADPRPFVSSKYWY